MQQENYFIVLEKIGEEVEKGFWPKDMKLLGQMVEDISYNNALNYFPMQVNP